MDAFAVRDEVLGDYADFVRSFLTIKDDTIRDRVASEIDSGLLWPEPWLGLNPAFAPGGTVSDLVAEGVLHERCRAIFRARNHPGDRGRELGFHRHQAEAFRLAREQQSYVLTTGTGSGKSLSYIVPIVDRVLREGSGRGVRAIVVYPMNALANSQLGELEKFLGTTEQAVTFARYTGQESKTDREQILRDKPDILLTNYMMLELMLTRPYERLELIASANELSFLVLDELHTYRGRQGADVAMLVRRLRGAVEGGGDLQCIGTSATLAGPGTDQEQRTEVAHLANRIFGTTIGPDNIVGETLQRATEGTPGPAELGARIGLPTRTTYDELRREPLAAWVETTFGLEPKDGRLVRRRPTRLRQAAKELATATETDEKVCEDTIREVLLTGSNTRDEAGRALFAFKLHQFIGKGDTAYVTLEPPEERYLTTQYQRSAPGEPKGRPLFPLSFCRECGQEYLAVVRSPNREVVAPRTTGPGAQPAEGTEGLLLLREIDWPTSDEALLDLVPDEWIVGDGGPRRLVDDRRKRLPAGFRVDRFGTIGDHGTPAAFFETLHFCPGCGTNYESTQQSEFSRVATLGTEGRASAVSVLSQAVVRVLRSQQDLDAVARKFLAFSDNRQDASLQAGHFNDFVLVALIRSALHAAVRHQQEREPDEPLTDEDLAARIVDRLQDTPADYAQDPEAGPAIAKLTTRALRNVVAHLVWADLRRGWRITMPNLEQTGQLVLTYLGLQELAADDTAWSAAGEPLTSADTETRLELMQVLLDELRRNLCVATEHLTEEKYESARSAAAQRLTPSWQLNSEQGTYAAICYAGPRPKGGAPGVGSDLYLSGLGLYGKWLRRPQRFPHSPWSRCSYRRLVLNAYDRMASATAVSAGSLSPTRLLATALATPTGGRLMAEERVYSLGSAGTTPAFEASLSALSYKERGDLQQWILADPTLVEPGLLVLTEEYAAWMAHDGASVKDRLDLLAFDQDGRTVVIELKRDDAPSDIHLQAITYAAMASRFTLSDLVRIHRKFLTDHGSTVETSDVEALLRGHVADELSEDALKTPRIILVARRFPAQVTASAVWLNEKGIDVKLVQIRVWKTAFDTVLTSSVVFPVPGAEEFIVEPDRQRAADVKKEVTERTRARKAVTRIIDAGLLQEGDVIRVNEYTELPPDVRATVMTWTSETPERGRATWVIDRSEPLRWAVDGKLYSPTTLIKEIVWLASGFKAPALYGTRWWADKEGHDLAALADLAGD